MATMSGYSMSFSLLHKTIFFLVLATVGLASQPAGATVSVCVSTPQQLKTALDAWVASSGDTYEIHLVQGTYAQTGNAFFDQTFPDGNNSNLRLRGGYTANCAGRQLLASNTVIDGQNVASNGFTLTANSNALIEGLTFARFTRPVDLSDYAGDSSYVLEARYIVAHDLSNSLGGNQGTFALSGSTQVRFHDSLIYDVAAPPPGAAVELYAAGDAEASIVNVTIVNNTGTGLLLYNVGGSATIVAQNDIVWGNSDTGIAVAVDNGAPSPSIDHSDYQSASGSLTLGVGNHSTDPTFVNPGSANFMLQALSPAINAGAASVPAGYPSFDLAGHARLVGSRVDMGAYEATVDDLNNFIVTTTNDNGDNTSPTTGSLRAAIKAGNAFAGPSKITFAVPGSCPRTFTLAAALPDITTDITIDGTSQPGWIPNSNYGQFDATLCAFFNGNGSAPYGLHIPAFASNARLVAKGLMFTGFNDAAIRIDGGANHLINGNQFGAIAFAQSSHDAIRVGGNSGAAYIGGFDDPALVNLIAGATNIGIYIDNIAGHSTVGNNLIGYQANGSTPGANGAGIFISNSPSNFIAYNYVGYNTSEGILIAGPSAAANLLEFNTVGLDRQFNAAGNVGAGITVSSGAHDNTIGASALATYGANSIGYNQGPGIWVTPSAGMSNRILANSIFLNGGLSVDLAGLGASANDAGDGDSGPNGLQNYPVLIVADRRPPGYLMIGSLDSQPSTTYRLDFYRGLCTSIGAPVRGSMSEFLGHATVTTNAAGHVRFNLPLVFLTNFDLFGVAATATDPAGNTSEVGECVPETADWIFRDRFE